jgi:cytosine/adenosine deaminase-related metal-dependent hydrolase
MTADLLVHNARLVATVDNARRELPGGWVAISNGLISGVGSSIDPVPAATERIDATGCLVTPGLINTHHHLYQNLTRAYPPMTSSPLFGWLQTLYPLWRALDEEGAHVSAWIGLAELALSGCTTSTDHLYLHPRNGGDLLSAEIAAAKDLGLIPYGFATVRLKKVTETSRIDSLNAMESAEIYEFEPKSAIQDSLLQNPR